MKLADRMIAPGATRGEVWSGFGAAVVGASVGTISAVSAGLPPLSVAVIALIAFDLFGGAVVNATRAAKRWYHRAGRTARHHLTFVALHVQPFILAWAVPGYSWLAASVAYSTALAGAVVVTIAPTSLRRPIAFGVVAFALAVTTSLVPVPLELGWFAPLLLVKLLLAHLLPDEADRATGERAAASPSAA